ncbi:MAG: nitrous oxide reductase accessory protein NosL [Isosphaeraceae bacterium]
MKRMLGSACLVPLMMLAGCGPVDRSRPPVVRLGQEACANCRMIIGDERFAAALTTGEGETLKFDDLGCLIQHESAGFRPTTVYWVRDFQGDGWLNARDAVFVHSRSIDSPMGFGLAACPTAQAAAEAAQEAGSRMLRFVDLWGFLEASSSEPPALTRNPRIP